MGAHARRRDGHGHARRAHAARTRRTRGPGGSAQAKPDLKKLWPQVWALVAPRKGLHSGRPGADGDQPPGRPGAALHVEAAARQGALAARIRSPSCCRASSRIVFAAMVVQAITSFSLTQLLSKAGQRLIAEMRRAGAAARGPALRGLLRREPHGHAGGAHHDRRGRRAQPGGHGAGGVCRRTADGGAGVSSILLHRSVTVTLTVFAVVGVFVFVLQYGFKTIRPIFRERGKINAEVTGRLDRVAGRRARDQGLSRRGARGHGVLRPAWIGCWTT